MEKRKEYNGNNEDLREQMKTNTDIRMYEEDQGERRRYRRIENAEEIERQKEIRRIELRERSEEIYHIR
ncbi:MAG: hypothetical protein ACOC1P_01195 [Minisyncoccales bacterium]